MDGFCWQSGVFVLSYIISYYFKRKPCFSFITEGILSQRYSIYSFDDRYCMENVGIAFTKMVINVTFTSSFSGHCVQHP